MIRSMWSAASGMQAQSVNIDVIANNIANVTTTGFKRSRAEFQDLLYETMRPPGASSSENTQVPTGIQIGHGTRPVAVSKNFGEGELQLTKNELDLAIEGDGFFQITQPNGETAYTRAGAIQAGQRRPGRQPGRVPARTGHHDSHRRHFGFRGHGRDRRRAAGG